MKLKFLFTVEGVRYTDGDNEARDSWKYQLIKLKQIELFGGLVTRMQHFAIINRCFCITRKKLIIHQLELVQGSQVLNAKIITTTQLNQNFTKADTDKPISGSISSLFNHRPW